MQASHGPSSHPARDAAGTTRVALDGELTIYRAAELKVVLQDALAAGADLELDLSAVVELDSAGVQLLMLAKRSAHQAGAALRLVSHSAAVQEVFELFNLAPHFGDPIVLCGGAHGS